MSNRVDRWATIHQFNKLVKAGVAAPLVAEDGTEYLLRANSDFEPTFWNPSDDSLMCPGLWWWENLRDTVDQAELDSLGTTVLQ